MESRKWLLLVTNLPGGNQTLRMRIWRALKAAGSASLRDGVYLLPASDSARRAFAEQVHDLECGGGNADVFAFESRSPGQRQRLVAQFDRTADYAEALTAVKSLRQMLPKLAEVDARRRRAAARRNIAALRAVDFFGGEARRQAEAAVEELALAMDARYSPDEPHSAAKKLLTVDARNYRARIWATRERPWIDRVCSAWLIRRFIDRRAKFLWLKRIGDCPKTAVGFDFDGAEFSHIGGKVTFEVLVQSFSLGALAGLAALGAIVHFLDVGGVPVPEAAGLAAVVAGARELYSDDDSLLEAVAPVLDSLYAAFSSGKV